MLKAQLPQAAGSGFRILCLGSHCDDIEIGCGGTILRLLTEHVDVAVFWVVFSSTPMRSDEARCSAESFLASARSKEILIKEFKDGFLPYQGAEVKNFFRGAQAQVFARFDIHLIIGTIFTRITAWYANSTWNTWRDHLILEYEIPKYDGDFGSPNSFVELDESFCRDKARYLVESFASQRDKHWFSEETFRAVLRLRGMECHSASGYAEAFYSRKLVLRFSPESSPQ